MSPIELAKDLLVLGLGLLPLVAAGAVLIAGLLRLAGRRRPGVSRVAQISSSAVARGIYPPSLRGGGPEVPVTRSIPIRRRRRPR